MDLGDMKSRDLGNLTSRALVEKGKEILVNDTTNVLPGEVPGTIKNQNMNHNAKKVGLGPNTKR